MQRIVLEQAVKEKVLSADDVRTLAYDETVMPILQELLTFFLKVWQAGVTRENGSFVSEVVSEDIRFDIGQANMANQVLALQNSAKRLIRDTRNTETDGG